MSFTSRAEMCFLDAILYFKNSGFFLSLAVIKTFGFIVLQGSMFIK